MAGRDAPSARAQGLANAFIHSRSKTRSGNSWSRQTVKSTVMRDYFERYLKKSMYLSDFHPRLGATGEASSASSTSSASSIGSLDALDTLNGDVNRCKASIATWYHGKSSEVAWMQSPALKAEVDKETRKESPKVFQITCHRPMSHWPLWTVISNLPITPAPVMKTRILISYQQKP
ncbi:hypothetical protein N7451_012262 [Penicillium sp. IBT 35674x]|nr:hypothetical protein N7451_012262 [Penicillium sp. IBT 35674x]